MEKSRLSQVALIAVAALLLLSIGSKASTTNLPAINDYFLYSNIADVGQKVGFVTILPAPPSNAPYAFPLTYNVYMVGKVGNDLVHDQMLVNSLVVSSAYFTSTVSNSNSVINQTFTAPLAFSGDASSNYSCYRVAITDSLGNTVQVTAQNCTMLTIFRDPNVSLSPTYQSVGEGNFIQINLTYAGGYRGAGPVADYHIKWYNDSSGSPTLMPQFSGSTQAPGPGPAYNSSVLTLNETAGATGTFAYFANITDANGGTGTSNIVAVYVPSTNNYSVLTVKLYPSNHLAILTGETIPFTAQAFFSSGAPMAGFTSYKWYVNGQLVRNDTFSHASDTYNDTDNYTFYGNSSTLTGPGLPDNVSVWIDIGPPGFFIDSATNITTITVNAPVTVGQTSTTTIGPSSTTSIPQSKGSGTTGNYTVTLSDNLSSSMQSTLPVYSISIFSGSSLKSSLVYYQNQLPVMIKVPIGQILNFSFACSLRSGTLTYSYAGDVYGLGVVSCGKPYTTYGTTSFDVIYSNSTAGLTVTPPTANTINLATEKIIHTNATTQPTKVNLSQYGINMTVKSTLAKEPLDIVVINKSAVVSPPDYQKIFSFYINSSSMQNATVNVILDYNCTDKEGTSGAFVLRNNTWVPIKNATMVPGGCEINFDAYPSQSIIGVFAKTPSQPATPVNGTGGSASGASGGKQIPTTTYIIAAVAAIVVISGIAYALSRRKNATPKSPPSNPTA